MVKQTFISDLNSANDIISKLMLDSFVPSDSSFYAFLFTATSCLDSALRHLNYLDCEDIDMSIGSEE